MKNLLLSRLIVVALVTDFCITALSQVYTFKTLAGNAGYGADDGIGSQAQFATPSQIAVDNLGNLYVADAYDNTIRWLTPVGTNWLVTTIAGLPGIYGSNDGTNNGAKFYSPSGIAVDSAGNVYVADFSNCTVRKIMHIGTNWVVTTIAGLPGNQGSADGTNGNASFHSPHGLAVDNAGNLYVTEFLNYGIRKITPVGTN